MKNLIILTGAPGAGKTSVINQLKTLGYQCVNESGRTIIQAQTKQKGSALPWIDKRAFRDKMFALDLKNHNKNVTYSAYLFFDRSLIDVYSYSVLEGIPNPLVLRQACHDANYSNKVFIFPPWKEIYCNDAERKQNFQEALDTYQIIRQTYIQFGYTLIEVPKNSIKKRVDFILGNIYPILLND